MRCGWACSDVNPKDRTLLKAVFPGPFFPTKLDIAGRLFRCTSFSASKFRMWISSMIMMARGRRGAGRAKWELRFGVPGHSQHVRLQAVIPFPGCPLVHAEPRHGSRQQHRQVRGRKRGSAVHEAGDGPVCRVGRRVRSSADGLQSRFAVPLPGEREEKPGRRRKGEE